MQNRSALALAVIALAAGALLADHRLAVPVAAAEQTWIIQAGGDPAPGVSAIDFYPRALTVAEGDTVTFRFPALQYHGVTFDAGEAAGDYLAEFKRNSPGPGDLDVSGVFFSRYAQGLNVSYDGSQPVSSGVSLAPAGERDNFSVTFPRAGVYYFQDPFYGPAMHGTITVLTASSSLPETPEQATTRGAAEAAADYAATVGMQGILPLVAPSAVGPGGAVVHTVIVGAPGYNTVTEQYGPRDLTVKRGDLVSWNVSYAGAEFHTVTLLSGSPLPSFLASVTLPSGSPGLVIPAAVAAPSGGTTYRGTGILNSGLLSPGVSFLVTFDAPPGTYAYADLFDAGRFDMRGTITVTP